MPADDLQPLLTADEVGQLFGVTPETAKMWARNRTEWIGAIMTPGGHWRFRPDRVAEALKERDGHP